jgi:hypothetical protein
MKTKFPSSLFLAPLLILSAALPLRAQSTSPQIAAVLGAMQFDASGTGTVPMVGVRGTLPLVGSWMLGEANFSFASLDEQFNELGTRVGVAEGQLQFQLPLARVRPYVGLGAGWLHYFSNAAGRAPTTPTFSGAAGLRLGLSHGLGAQGELRIRGWNYHHDNFSSNFGSSAAEWTAGLTYAF